MYWRDTWRFNGSIEYEFKYAGKYGAKGEKRGKRKRASPEQIKNRTSPSGRTRSGGSSRRISRKMIYGAL